MTKEEYIRLRDQRLERARQKRRKYAIRRLIVLGAALLILLIFILIISKIVHGLSSNSKAPDMNINTAQTSGEVQQPEETPEPAPPFYDPETENDLVKIAEAVNELHPDEKICYLTFDDGPGTKVTPQILETLEENDVKATFFMLGNQIKENRDIARQCYEDGHLIANHSMTHEYGTLYASVSSFVDEIERCYDLLCDTADDDDAPMKLVRFPGGCFNTSADRYSSVKMECKDEIGKIGFFEANWNALTGDAEGAPKSAEELVAYMQRYLSEDQHQVIVLMHDTDAKQPTADALGDVIEYFKDHGFEFRRLDEIPYYEDVEEYLSKPASTTDENDENDED